MDARGVALLPCARALASALDITLPDERLAAEIVRILDERELLVGAQMGIILEREAGTALCGRLYTFLHDCVGRPLATRLPFDEQPLLTAFTSAIHELCARLKPE